MDPRGQSNRTEHVISEHCDKMEIEQLEGIPGDQHDQKGDNGVSEEALGTNLPKSYWYSPGFIGTIIAFCLGNNASFVGSVFPQTTLLLINDDVGPSPDLIWIAIGWNVAFSVSFMLFGRLSDIFGRRYFLVGGNALCTLGSIVAATANSVNQVIAGSVLIGIGTTTQAGFVVALSELVPNKHRPFWISGAFFSCIAASCFGALFARKLALETSLGWRWDFWICCILSGLASILLFIFYKPPKFHMLHQNRTRLEQVKRIDFAGLLLFVAGLSLFLMGISWGGVRYPWKSGRVIGTITVGFCVLVAFVVYDALLHKGDPFLPMHLFKQRGFLAMLITAMVGSCVYYSMIVIWPQQITYLFPSTPDKMGLLACVVGSATFAGQSTAGPIHRLIKVQSRYIMIASTITLLASSAAMISVQPGTQARATGLMFMACYSVGLIETSALALAPLSCPPEDIGVANGALVAVRNGGASIATAIYSVILADKLSTFVPRDVSIAALDAGLPASSLPELLRNLSTDISGVLGMNPNIAAAVVAANAHAVAESFRYVWYAVIAFAVLAVVASSMTINYATYYTDDVSRKMHGRLVGDRHITEEKAENVEKDP